jgi:hypothetical protein
MTKWMVLAAAAALAIMMYGCAGRADVMEHALQSGELRLRGPLSLATAKARERMVEHCGGRYQLQVGTHLVPANTLGGSREVHYVCEGAFVAEHDAAAAMLAHRTR